MALPLSNFPGIGTVTSLHTFLYQKVYHKKMDPWDRSRSSFFPVSSVLLGSSFIIREGVGIFQCTGGEKDRSGHVTGPTRQIPSRYGDIINQHRTAPEGKDH